MKQTTTNKTLVVALPALFTACLLLLSCGGGGGSGGRAPSPDPDPPDPPPPAITVVVGPSSAVVQPGATQQFDATVSNATNTAVTWSVNAETGGNVTVGTVSNAGLYTAPDTVPAPDTVTITATSQEDASKSGSATVTIVSLGSGVNNALLNGRYAFVFSGSENSNGVFVAGGTFAADGNGNISDGLEDGNFAGGIFAEQPFTGIYAIGADRRGTMVIANTPGADCGCAPTQFIFKFNVVSDQLAHFIEFDGLGAGKGTIEKQDFATFSLAAIDGSHSFLLDGLDFENRLSIAGRFTSTSGALSEAIADINNAQTISTAQDISGALTLGANGRGTATLTTPVGELHFAYYIISNDKLILVGTDFFPVLSGAALRQTSAPFSNASLFGKYIFGMTASTHPRPQKVIRADVGYFEADGVALLSDGVLDRNSPSGVLDGSLLSGTYAISANGRGTATLDTEAGVENIVFYMASESEGFVLQVDASETDVNNVTSGRLRRQDTTVFSGASWQGPYGLYVTGSGEASDPTNISGMLAADGASVLTTTQDIYDGSLHPDESLTGAYEVQATGRGTAAFPTTDFNVYFASSSEIFLIGMNPGVVHFGAALKQE